MDFYSDDSDPDIDEDLREDLDALRRSCVLSGADPDAAVAQVSSCLAAAAAPSTPAASASAPAKAAANYSSDDDEDEDEDLALVRSIRASLHLNRASPLPDAGASSPRPICTWPPSDTEDEEEDDLETLRAIQRRFSHYQSNEFACDPIASDFILQMSVPLKLCMLAQNLKCYMHLYWVAKDHEIRGITGSAQRTLCK